MVLQKIAQEIIKYATRGAPVAKRLVDSDKLVLNKAWTGFKHKSSIVSGIRSGLFTGGIVGQFIRDSDNPEMDAQVPYSPQTNKPYKARNRRRRQCYRYDKFGNRSNIRCRQPKSRSTYRSRNRF